MANPVHRSAGCSPEDVIHTDVNWLASFAGAMAQSPSDSSAEEGPLPGDLETARLFGQRIAETAAPWNR